MLKWIGLSFLALAALMIIGFTCGMCGDALNTAKKEFAPSALLKKYEYFKQLSAAIDKKRADIAMYREEILSYYDDNSKPLSTDKNERFYLEQRKSELIGIISVHNQLVAEYNTRMVEFNYRFTNVGDLPYSNAEPLQREYKTYILTLKKQTK